MSSTVRNNPNCFQYLKVSYHVALSVAVSIALVLASISYHRTKDLESNNVGNGCNPFSAQTKYGLWNLAAGFWLHWNQAGTISCSANNMDQQTAFTALGAGKEMWALQFDTSNLKVLNVTNNGNNIGNAPYISGPSLTKSMKFVLTCHGSFAIFQNVEYGNKYLACSSDGTGTALLVSVDTLHPDPRALFISILHN